MHDKRNKKAYGKRDKSLVKAHYAWADGKYVHRVRHNE